MKYAKFRIFHVDKFDKNKINTTVDTGGRFGNIFIRNVISSRISKLNNLNFSYDKIEEMDKLGISLYKEGTKIYNKTLLVSDNNIDAILFNTECYKTFLYGNNIFFKQHNYSPFEKHDFAWCQTELIAKFIKDWVKNQQNSIVENNPFKENYNNNNSVFIHVRLGDTISLGFSTDFNYYDKALSSISFDKGYISSDSIEDERCQKLIQKYGLEIYNDDEVNTILFASTNKYIILSSGTFSWLMGIFGFFSTIYYPKIKVKWHGNIFVFPQWNEIDY